MEEPESDPDFDEEQYQNELNDAVDDGGGCMETLKQLIRFPTRTRLILASSTLMRTAGLYYKNSCLIGWCCWVRWAVRNGCRE